MTDLATHLTQAIAGLLVVLGLIVLGAFAFNRIRSKGGFGNFLPMSSKGRLKIIESLSLDPQRQLVLIERDGQIGHLVLLGAEGETLLEANIPTPKEKVALKGTTTHLEVAKIREPSLIAEPPIPREAVHD